MTAQRMPASTDQEIEEAIDASSLAVRRGSPVVLPTDTVYGIGADAFDVGAVARLLAAKGRGREKPPPVLIAAASTIDALATRVPDYARVLVERFWPGPLTVVCHQQPSLQWDLGETNGTVAVRVPDHEVARRLLERTGPLAVSSANLTGSPAALDADAAMEMLGESVAVVIDAGTSPGGEASTIVDATGDRPRVLRVGAIGLAELDEALAELGVTVALPEAAPTSDAADDPGEAPSDA